MRCPYCGEAMERGYMAAGCTSGSSMTRFEWSDSVPRFSSVAGAPLSKFDERSWFEGYRCRGCRAVLVRY